MKKAKREYSIKNLIILFMIAIMLFQTFVFVTFVVCGGGFRDIIGNSIEPLAGTTTLRARDIETALNNTASILVNNSAVIETNLNNVAKKYNASLSKLGDDQNAKMEMYQTNIDVLRTMASMEHISGAFLIMDTNLNVPASISGVFLQKADQSTANADSTTLLIGGDYLLQNGVTTKSIYWSQCLPFNSLEDFDFYQKPLEIAKANPEIPDANLGYWSDKYEINDSKRQVVAYVLPIKDPTDNEVVGVMGIEVDLNYIQLLLPYYELNSQGEGSYILTRMSGSESNDGTRIVVSGKSFNEINNYSPEVEYSAETVYDGGVRYLNAKGKGLSKVYATTDVININSNANYNYQPIVLSGVVESKYLLTYVNKLKTNLITALVLTMILCLIFVFKFADMVSAPIKYFVGTIQKIRPDNLITPEPTAITEINELGESITRLTEETAAFSTKASAIISMTGISIAAFEYDLDSNLVFCTEDMFKVFGIRRTENALYIQKNVFDDHIKPIINTETIQPGIDMVASRQYGKNRMWLHIKTVLSGDDKIIGTVRDVTVETLEKQRLDFERDHDMLTEFLKRKPFVDAITERFNAKPPAYALLAVCKIVDLPALNARYGSISGDKYIVSIAEVFKSVFGNKSVLIARTSGDEFTFMIEGINNAEIIHKFNALLEKLNNTDFVSDEINQPHNIYAGVAWYPASTRNLEELLAYAEFAAQTADSFTGTGRNLVQEFSQEAYNLYLEKHKKDESIDKMLEENAIGYAYQPIIDTSTGDIYGYEALMRPKDKDITPGDVIEFATKNDRMYAVEKSTWVNALKDYKKQVDCLSPKKLFINSIPNQLLSDEDLATIEKDFDGYLDNIVLEILENEQTVGDFIEKKREIKNRWNCLLALDDFGSGYANENSLLTIKPDLIKLDLDLVANIDKDADRQSLVKNIVGYAHNRDIKVLAEGIENREQMNILLSLDVDLLQGFYLAKPNETVLTAIDERIKNEIITYDPNDMFYANVALRM